MIANTDYIKPIKLSIVIPVYSGADYLEKLVHQIDELCTSWITHDAPIALSEAIFVDDASIDNSSSILNDLSAKYPWITTIQLSRNFGQHPATSAGILYSSGDWVVTMDEDLQHPPAMIEALLLKAVMESFDIVYANPQKSVHQSLIRDLGSRFYKRLIARLTGNKNIPYFNSFRLIRGSIARAASSVCSHDTYFDIALSWFTQKVGFIAVVLKDERYIISGKSGYSFLKLISHARRMILSTHSKALRILGLVGFLAFLVSLFYGSYIFFNAFFHWEVINIKGWSSLLLSILFMGGVSVLLGSIILEYLSVILLHTQGKPTFFVVDRSMDKTLLAFFKDRNNVDSAQG